MRLRRMPETFQSTPSVWRETVLQVVGQSTGHHFNPLPPYGGRHQSAQYHLHYKLFQSTPSVWRETHCCWEDSLKILHFNPLPPYGGRLPGAGPFQTPNNAFQSTPSVWRETFCSSAFRDTLSFQSTPSVWRETDTIIPIYLDGSISIHSLRMEGD